MKIRDYLPQDLFKGKTVFVTGGGSGINLGVARNFAAVGADIGICGRKQDRLDAAADELRALGARVVAQAADVRDFEALEASMKATQDELGPIWTLVCGAAGNFLAPAETLSPNGFKTVIEIDLVGSFNAARAAFTQLKATRGNILFISAGQSYMPYFAQCHAGAAKAGIDNLMRNLAMEWGRYGIRANSIVPGPIEETEGMRRLSPSGGEAKSGDRFQQSIPLGRFGTVDEIGHMAVFLASPLAAYVTGCMTIVDGGQNLPGSGVMMAAMLERAGEGR
jgi:NAD(P)-dependent dehydrogenase (short-subunit alcohol dehydrogenase family)